MSAPAVFHERAIWYESAPSVLTTVQKCAAAKDASGNAHPVRVIYLPLPAAGAPLQITDEQINQVRVGAKVGYWTDPRHYPFIAAPNSYTYKDMFGNPMIDPLEFRKRVSKFLSTRGRIGEPVMFDFEKVSMNWHRDFLLGRVGDPIQGWRGSGGNLTGGANPTRESSWTDAIFQMGGYSSEVLELYERFNFALFLQLYTGGDRMEQLYEREDAMRQPIDYGFGGDIFPFYDCAGQDQVWKRGYCTKACGFTSNRWNYLFT